MTAANLKREYEAETPSVKGALPGPFGPLVEKLLARAVDAFLKWLMEKYDVMPKVPQS